LKVKSNQHIDSLRREFPEGSLVTVEWLCHGPTYRHSDEGWELSQPSLVLVLRHLPEHSYMSGRGHTGQQGQRWVMPFECLHRGELRISNTFSCVRAECVTHGESREWPG